MLSKTFAAIDVGSYELSMKIFEVSKKKGMRQIDHVVKAIDMGTETFNSGLLSFERVEELENGLKELVKIMRSYRVDSYKAYGTSAIRETKNQAILLDQIKQRTGLVIEVLSNSEQRFLDYKSIAFEGKMFEQYIGDSTAILDVGGGSVQISLFDNKSLLSTQNLKLGVLRLLERMKTIGASLHQYEDLVGELCTSQLNTYKKLYIKDRNVENLILVDDYISLLLNKKNEAYSGNGTATAQVIREHMEKAKTMSAQRMAKSLSIAEESIPNLYISLIFLQKVVEILGVKNIWAPGVTLCDGIAYEYAEKNGIIVTNHNFEDDIRSCALHTAKRFSGSKKRAETLEKIALNIFDAMEDFHGLSKRDRLLLQISTYLHDCGKYVSMTSLAECSYSIIKNTEIIGLSHKERMIIANTVRFNQQIFDYYEDFDDREHIDSKDHMQIAKLTAILRLANGLDRSHKMKFKDIKAEVKGSELIIFVETDEDITLERELFINRAKFFEETYNLKPVIKQKRTY